MVRIVSKGAFGAPLILKTDDLNTGLAAMIFSPQFTATETSSFARSDGKTATRYQITGHSDFASAVALSVANPAGVYIAYATYFDSSNSALLTLKTIDLQIDSTGGASPVDPSTLLASFLSNPRLSLTGDDHILGDSFDDSLVGLAGNDRLFGRDGDDTLDGGDGDDKLFGGAGADILIGGSGFDVASYGGGAMAVTADLGNSASNTGDAAGDSYKGIEGLTGTDFNDLLAGNGKDNELKGGDGDDVLLGSKGDDTLRGGDGDDILRGGDDDDVLIGGKGQDVLSGGNGNDDLRGGAMADLLAGKDGDDLLDGGKGDDTLKGGAGADFLQGGAGFDTASYKDGPGAVSASLDDSSSNTGDAAGDTYVAIEALAGTKFDDSLTGDDGDNQLLGLAGDDFLDGGAGDDEILGKSGDDHIVSTDGRDIVDGGKGYDTLDLSGRIDGVYLGTGNESFLDISVTNVEEFIGSQSHDTFNLGSTTADIRVDAGDGWDYIDLGLGNGVYYGGEGGDSFDISSGDNVAYGGAGDDNFDAWWDAAGQYFGGDGDDRFFNRYPDVEMDLHGDAGNDGFTVFGGNLTLTGGSGTDRFIFYDFNAIDVIITDWDKDTILIDNSFTTDSEAELFALAQVSNGNLTLTLESLYGGPETVTLLGVDDVNLLAGYIQFFPGDPELPIS